MEEIRTFARILDVRNGKKLKAEEVAEYEAIVSQVGDVLGEWVTLSIPSKPEGTRAKRRRISEIVDYVFVKHPEEDGRQRIDLYHVGTSGGSDEIIRYKSISFPAWYETEVFTG